jgi:hypothetical protein
MTQPTSKPTPTTPAECYAAQERVLALLDNETVMDGLRDWMNFAVFAPRNAGNMRLHMRYTPACVRSDVPDDVFNLPNEAHITTAAVTQILLNAATRLQRVSMADHAALLAAHAEALSGIEGLAIAWEATAARIRRTEVRPDGQWLDIESAQVHYSLTTCARQLRALLPSPPVEELASPDDDESETDFLVGQRVIVHGTLTHIHDTSDGEDADEFSGEPGVIVADVTDNPYYHHLVYVNRTQRVYGCVIGDLSYVGGAE